MRKIVVAAVALGGLWLAPGADAAIPEVFHEGPGDAVACSTQGDGDRVCGNTAPRSTAETFDGLPIDVNVAFPADDGVGADGDYPLIMMFHGYGGSKLGFGSMERFLDRGYAVFSMTDRGFHESCGTAEAREAADDDPPADPEVDDTLPGDCTDGHIRLLDTRYEVRDAQHFAGRLADEEVIDPQRIGSVGGSYGGGMSMSLGALKDRIMLPDGSLAPWTSPDDGDPMRIAAATPNIPWTDLAYALAPNGGTLDYVGDAPYRGRMGVMKQSLVEGLYVSGAVTGIYAPVGTDPDADVNGWINRLRAGEPYDGDALVADMIDELTTHHSSYYIDDSQPPAPMLISSGYTDDLFPADEALRYYHRTRDTHPGTPLSLFFGNFGHQRAENRPADADLLRSREDAWLDFYVKGTGSTPFQGVEAQTQTCPDTVPSGGPVSAANWALLAPGEVRFTGKPTKVISPDAGSIEIASTFDPVSSGQDPCRRASGADQAGAASYRLPAAKSAYTMMGAATVIADISSPTPNSELVARLLDVAPDGQESLVNRAILRPAVGSARQVFQLHPNGWQFAQGHVPKLELLPRDRGSSILASYARPADGQGQIEVSNLELRLPVLEKVGVQGGYVKAPAKKVVPSGYALAKDFAALGSKNARLGKGKLRIGKGGATVDSPDAWAFCHATVTVLSRGGKGGKSAKKKKGKALARGKVTVKNGKKAKAKLKLTKAGRRALRGKRRAKVRVELTTKEQTGKVKAKRVLLLRR
jgi:Acetyl xylan esterase (AXE1)